MDQKVSKNILGGHPLPCHPFGACLLAENSITDSGIDQRKLSENSQKDEFLKFSIESVHKHHASADALNRYHELLELYKSLGMDVSKYPISPYPTVENTQKGNYAEIILAEYILATTPMQLPIYRLRYNPNPNQSMKGDDVLAFDLDADPVRIIVGEAKFRQIPQKQDVIDTVDALIRSNKTGLPVSLHFVAERLFELGQHELAKKIINCELLFLYNKLSIDYVGLLMSDKNVHDQVKRHTKSEIHNLLFVSLAFESPEMIIKQIYEGLVSRI